MGETEEPNGEPQGKFRTALFLFCFLAALMLGLFSLAGSILVLLYARQHTEAAVASLRTGLWLRAAFFAAVAGIAAYGAWRFRASWRLTPESAPGEKPAKGSIAGWAIAALLAAAVALPNLAVYPWAAPDEMHHLTVAKNLAFYGEYASGNPDKGFRRFDPYDSVGPPVILPIAAVFRVFGVSVGGARGVMAVYFLLFLAAVFGLFRGIYGGGAAVAATVGAAAAFSSVYLSRTLYGEVPGLFWMITGLIAWRAGLKNHRAMGWPFMAGLLFGLAILCKTILVLSAFAFASVIWLDFVSHRRIRWVHLAFPAAGAASVIGGWWAVQTLARSDVAEAAGGTLGLYQHYLLFGLEPFWRNFRFAVLSYPLAHIALLAGALFAVNALFRRRYDPPLLVLLLIGFLFFYWYLFFTPGQLPRYLWFTYAAVTPFLGVFIHQLVFAGKGLPRRAPAVALAMALALPNAMWLSGQLREVYGNREMAGDYAVAEAIGQSPRDTRIATTFFPMQGTLAFMLDRTVDTGEQAEDLLLQNDVVIILASEAPEPSPAKAKRQRIGRYVILWREPMGSQKPPKPER